MNSYTPTIGIEVHAELKTQTKMFCSSKNDPHDTEPNTHVCPICMGHPGTLPVINKEAVRHVLSVGAALDGALATYTEFDRKNYFYPDIPKGYQISQYIYPLVKGGELSGITITRVHLEEDTARSLHDQGSGSVVDYNRAGVPLMELVTEPVIHDAKSAGDFARELQLLLKTLGVSDANMERGEMRVEANISVSSTDAFGTKVEVKNLNSFKSVESAIEYEIKRQIEVLEDGGVVVQETRGWDENRGKTYSQRLKESADDYRYFPDPDLPKLDLSGSDEFSLSRIKEAMPIIPSEKRKKYDELGIQRNIYEVLISNIEADRFFNRVLSVTENVSKEFIVNAANYVTSDVIALTINSPLKYSFLSANPSTFGQLISMVTKNEITSRVAKDLLAEVLFDSKDPQKLALERNLLQTSSEEALTDIIREIIEKHPSVVAEYRSGKEAALQFLIGQGMKATRGSANPTVLSDLLKRNLK